MSTETKETIENWATWIFRAVVGLYVATTWNNNQYIPVIDERLSQVVKTTTEVRVSHENRLTMVEKSALDSRTEVFELKGRLNVMSDLFYKTYVP